MNETRGSIRDHGFLHFLGYEGYITVIAISMTKYFFILTFKIHAFAGLSNRLR